ncbi:orotidine-5'-phosphate decarboxylase [Acetohalobium arabaticum]|uniref:Orotidine 5'-phosphate decarboxylase n=1 Tax=Acetohalobium arabaticum (strain ATCC 49924 / DSM 5501 / Z-7288) TaxID=574087 RepID=D9QPJ0_ACEAZ|nr:orotidine-5'-phosphate decarboxylase [Acetohalobium arabaticum]ADL12431.1 orotidine 5'-phosphate decarboxylase [Acetohalobium arabaticum DSM 5501]
MSNFTTRLKAKIEEKKSFVCVGLDPRLNRIPEQIKEEIVAEYGKTKEAVGKIFLEFNQGIIDAVADYAAAVKPQIAFYEQYGHQGIKAYEETIEYAKKKDLLVIGDAKRNDIGSTAKAYADGHLGEVDFWEEAEVGYGADALTVNGYLGSDGIDPFVEACNQQGKGIFVLVRTSNPSAGELQDLEADNKRIYEVMAELVNDWGEDIKDEDGFSAVGAVIGATYPEEAEELREIMGNAYFLVPGYGAQGAGAKEVVPSFKDGGYGAIVNSARGIIFAYQREPWKDRFSADEYQEAAQAAVEYMREDINTALNEAGKLPW